MRKTATSPSIAGNDLNRCEVPALQHKIRAISKRTAAFFANSRLRGVEMGGGGSKRVAWDGKKERGVQMKTFFQHTKISIFHCNKTNVQLQISSVKTYCELAVKQLFFEKYQSCVSCTATLSHRFKAFSPAFCRQNRFRHEPPEFSAKLLPAEL